MSPELARAKLLLARDLPLPVDLQVALLNQGVDVEQLERTEEK